MRPALILLAVTLAVLPHRAAGAQASHDPGDAVLAPGDILRIAVWRRPEMSGEFVVAPDSTITHPLYRAVKVAGIPLPMVEARVREFLDRQEASPTFVLSPLLRVFVGGEVRQPGVHTVPPGTTVAQAVALAGGATDRGRLDRVTVARGVSRDQIDLTSGDSRSATAEVRSNDQLFVARRRNFIGEVLAPTASVVAAIGVVANIILQLR